MAIQLINIGNVANDGTGDDLREAFVKVNANFEDLDLRDNEKTTVTNLGSGAGIFDSIVNYDIRMKSIKAGDDIVVNANAQGEIVISAANVNFKQLTVETNDDQSYTLNPNEALKLFAGTGIDINVVNGNSLIIENTNKTRLSNDLSPLLNSNLDANGREINNASIIRSNEFIGNVTGNVTGQINGVDLNSIAPYFDDYFDFGEVGRTVNSLLDWLLEDTDVDFGSFSIPDPRTIDLGTIA
jgi:hypothetical protein